MLNLLHYQLDQQEGTLRVSDNDHAPAMVVVAEVIVPSGVDVAIGLGQFARGVPDAGVAPVMPPQSGSGR
jgi:hypothetical protein